MIICRVKECDRKPAVDGSLLCELLHPLREGGEVSLGYSIAHAIVPGGRQTRPHRSRRFQRGVLYHPGGGETVINGKRQEV
jgi:hypothetical protein